MDQTTVGEIGSAIRRLRKERNLTIDDMGSATGLSRAYISQIETNKASPSLPTIRKICSGLGISPALLFEDPSDGCFVTRAARRTILRYDGVAWRAMESGTTEDLYGIWGSSGSDIFAVGEDGVILHYGGTTWSMMETQTQQYFLDVWGTSSTDVFAVGTSGTILHYDGNAWSAMVSGITSKIREVWGSSSSDVYAVGDHGRILHYDGITWSAMVSGSGGGVVGVIRDAWQEYPKGVVAWQEGVEVEIWPGWYGERLKFRTGWEEGAIRFGGTRDEEEFKRLVKERPTAPLNLKSMNARTREEVLWVEEMVANGGGR